MSFFFNLAVWYLYVCTYVEVLKYYDGSDRYHFVFQWREFLIRSIFRFHGWKEEEDGRRSIDR